MKLVLPTRDYFINSSEFIQSSIDIILESLETPLLILTAGHGTDRDCVSLHDLTLIMNKTLEEQLFDVVKGDYYHGIQEHDPLQYLMYTNELHLVSGNLLNELSGMLIASIPTDANLIRLKYSGVCGWDVIYRLHLTPK